MGLRRRSKHYRRRCPHRRGLSFVEWEKKRDTLMVSDFNQNQQDAARRIRLTTTSRP